MFRKKDMRSLLLVSGLCERQSKTASVANAAAETLRHLEPIFIFVVVPGGDHELLVTQGHHGIDSHRPPAGNVAGEERDSDQRERGGHQGQRISRGHAVQERS